MLTSIKNFLRTIFAIFPKWLWTTLSPYGMAGIMVVVLVALTTLICVFMTAKVLASPAILLACSISIGLFVWAAWQTKQNASHG